MNLFIPRLPPFREKNPHESARQRPHPHLLPPDVLHTHLPTIIFTFVALLLLITASHILTERNRDIDNARLALNADAHVFAEHVSSSIIDAETVLAFLAEQVADAPPGTWLPFQPQDFSPLRPGSEAFALYDAACRPQQTSRTLPPEILQDGENMCRALASTGQVQILRQATPSTPAERLLLGRRISDGKSLPQGMIMAVLRLEDLRNPLINSGDEDSDVLALIGPAGRPLASWHRSGFNSQHAELDRAFSFPRNRTALQPSTDNFIISVHDLEQFPLRVGMAISTERVLATWRKNSVRSAAVVLMASIAISALGFIVTRQQRRRILAEHAMHESEARYRAVAEHFPDGAIMLFDKEMHCILANGKGLAVLGLDSTRIRGCKPADFLPVHASEPLELNLHKAFNGQQGMVTLSVKERILEVHLNPVLQEGQIDQCVALLQDITIKEYTQHELRDSEFRLNEAQRIARLGSFSTNFKTGKTTWSEELFHLAGLPVTAPPLPLDTFIKRYAPQEERWLNDLLSTSRASHLSIIKHTFECVSENGRKGHVAVHMHLHSDATGNPESAHGTIQDTTDVQEASLALKRSEADLHEALRIARMVRFTHDHGTSVTYASPQMLRLLGIAENDDTTPQARLGLLMPDLLATIATAARTSAPHSKQDAHRYAINFRTMQGELLHGQLHLRVLRDADGTPLVTHGVLQDVSDIVNIEQALRRSESTYRALSSNFPNGVVLLVDGKDELRVATGQAIDSIAFLCHPAQGNTLSTCMPPDLLARLTPLLHEAREKKSTTDEVLVGNILFDVVAVTVPDEEDSGSVMLLLQDASARKDWERGLRAAKEAAEAASELKSQFVANISHEMRTPLSGILGIVDVALDSENDPQQKRYLGIIQNVAQGLLAVINDLLDFSRLEAGRMPLDHVPYNLRDTVDEALAPLALQAESKGLAMIVKFHEGTPKTLQGDPLRLRQILVNLLGNAIKFTDSGHVRLDVMPACNAGSQQAEADNPAGGTVKQYAEAGRPAEDEQPATGQDIPALSPAQPGTIAGVQAVVTPLPGNALIFSVSDSGPGIASEKISQLFESFAQADGSHARRHTGSGLGLAISRHLVELQGGIIDVESTPGAGSRFWFTLPLGDSSAAAETTSIQRTLSAPATSSESLHILLAEDNELNREFLTIFLEGEGHSVTTATNGYEALAVLERETIDLALMDVQMPEMSGLEAVKHIRASGKAWSNVPVIALTAHSMTGDRDRFIANGMNDFIPKPVNKIELFAAIARHAPSGRTTPQQ